GSERGPVEAAVRGGARRPPRAQAGPKGLGGEQVEGRQAVRELLLGGRRKVRELWLASDLDPAPVLDDIRELAGEARVLVQEVGRAKLESTARTDAPQGVLAFAAPLPEVELDDLLHQRPGGRAPFLLVCDGITDPGNLGALLRSAEGAGVSGVVLPRHRAVHVTPAVTKAAAGAIEHLPMALVGGLPTALLELRKRGVWVLGLDEAADQALWEVGVGDQAVALVLGAEGAGLSRLVRERCDAVARIPMLGRLSSLNVSTAGALACYEVARHRAGAA
ncbi:MAG: rRNA methyltransferase, partial [Acidimicrobiales bacterium]|nr:rRNA methyltransferase [Acidimicrobiales bacterium]